MILEQVRLSPPYETHIVETKRWKASNLYVKPPRLRLEQILHPAVVLSKFTNDGPVQYQTGEEACVIDSH